MYSNVLRGFVLALWMLNISGVHAQQPAQLTPTSPFITTPLRVSSEAESVSLQTGREWGLTREEWARYRQLMRGPLGVYSPTLDPLTALGLEARSDNERKRIAELQVRMEAQRVEKLLAYQRAYDTAWKRVYPTLVPFPEAAPQNTAIRADGAALGRLAVFVKEDCPACDQRVKDLEGSGAPFDLYVVGTRGDDARIRAWATRLKIDPARVRAGSITLNHDGGRWFAVGTPGSLPAVMRSVNGRWTRE